MNYENNMGASLVSDMKLEKIQKSPYWNYDLVLADKHEHTENALLFFKGHHCIGLYIFVRTI